MEIFEQFARERARLAVQFLSDEKAFAYLEGHTAAADRAVLGILRKHGLSERLALCAVGGYGRGQLCPFSDLDLLFLLPEDYTEDELRTVEAVLQDLWSLGLNIGSSVRRIAECLEQAQSDITAQTAMLESRFLFGNRALFAAYEKTLDEQLDVRGFFRSKLFEQQQRHIKYGETPYALEPNIKESPGGLRDLNILAWLARAAGLGATWEEVASSGLITRHEADLLKHVAAALYRLRIHMHLLSNRHEDRLLFENQECLAQSYRIGGTHDRRPSEILMQRYYLNAKSVVQLNTIILQSLKERYQSAGPVSPKIRKVYGDFIVEGEVLDIAREDLFQTNPGAVLLAFWLPMQDPSINRRSTRLLRALLASHAFIDEALLETEENREIFLKILQAKKGVYHALSEMNRWGILGHLLGDFRRIVGQMQHDLFHAYTVDQHTILAIRYLRHFTKSENAHEMPFCTELMMSLKGNWRLVLALLFHDIGKGCGGDHSTIGAEKFLRFAKVLKLKAEDSDYIEFLIRYHLLLSQTAQTQDISDPTVIEDFARKVGTHERLVGLYLMTVCDIRATSPSVWNTWKAQLLRELFTDAERLLLGEHISRPLLLQARRTEALKLCHLSENEEKRIRTFWNELDIAYFMRHSAKNIAWHAQTLAPYLESGATFATSRRLAGTKNNLEFIVLTEDQPELFARIVSFFEYHRLSVLEARIHTAKNGWVLDSFIVVNQGLAAADADLSELGTELTELLSENRPTPPAVTGRLSRRSRTFPITPKIVLRPDANGKHFLLSIVATDRIGLLSAIAKVFTRFHVYLLTARITTLGERAEDVFIIDAPNLQHALSSSEFERTLLEALEV